MKRKRCVDMILIVTLLFTFFLTACQSGANTDSVDYVSKEGDNIRSVEKEDEVASSVPAVTADWTIEEAIENHMRFASHGSFSLYAVDTKLYASFNEMLAKAALSTYADLVDSGEASPTIRQIQIERYRDEPIFLDSNGKMWYQGKQSLSEYNITYFSCKGANNGEKLAAVTDEGKVIWSVAGAKGASEQEGLNGVKYVDVNKDLIAYVREDGSAGYCRAGEECHDIEGWNEIAMVFIYSSGDILGLKRDGTIVAETCEGEETRYSSEIFSWSDIVYLSCGSGFVAGLKSDGSVVYADAGASSTEYLSVLDKWSNVMVIGAYGGKAAITADNGLLGDADSLVYAWNLTKPWEGSDAALRDHLKEDHHIYTEKLAEID